MVRVAVDVDHSARRDSEPEIGLQALILSGAAAKVADVSIGTFGHRIEAPVERTGRGASDQRQRNWGYVDHDRLVKRS